MTLLPAFLAVVISGPLIAEVAKEGVPVSIVTQFMLVVIVLGAGTDYGLFLVFRIREYLRSGKDPKEATALAVGRVGESITFSAATVIAALASLTLASFGLTRSLGIPLAIGIAIMLIAGLT
ncbi:MMPL domain protein, partial [mine drainage metagenome]